MRTPSLIRKRATLLLTRVQANSKDEVLRADCVRTLAVLHGGVLQKERRVAANTPVDDAPSGGLSTVTPVALQTLVGKQ